MPGPLEKEYSFSAFRSTSHQINDLLQIARIHFCKTQDLLIFRLITSIVLRNGTKVPKGMRLLTLTFKPVALSTTPSLRHPLTKVFKKFFHYNYTFQIESCINSRLNIILSYISTCLFGSASRINIF
jgi:hypothetical protein